MSLYKSLIIFRHRRERESIYLSLLATQTELFNLKLNYQYINDVLMFLLWKNTIKAGETKISKKTL